MIKSVSCIALRKLGLHAVATKWLLTFLDTLKCTITIGAQEAVDSYTDRDLRSQGVGQGCAGAGNGWSANDSLITEEYQERAIPAIMVNPMKTITITKSSTAYVDDRTLYTIAKNLRGLLVSITANVKHLQDALKATGGALNFHK